MLLGLMEPSMEQTDRTASPSAQGESAQATQPESLGPILEEYRESVTQWVGRVLRKSPLQRLFSPTDIVQSTFLRALQKKDQFETVPPKSRKSWLGRTALRLIFLEYRKLKPDAAVQTPITPAPGELLRFLIDSDSSLCTKLHREEAELQVKIAISSLSPRDQQLLYLRHELNLPWATVGQKLGCSADAARVRYHATVVPELAMKLQAQNKLG